MIKEIKYNGHSASPSDYQSPDGDMASMLNCIPERGALKPIPPPETVESFGENTTVLAIHKVANKEHYILYDGNKLTWEDVNDDSITGELYDFSDDGGVASVTPIGNTLAVLDGNGTIHYFLWRNDAYSNLGTQLPELNIEPCIETRVDNLADLKSIYPELSNIETSVELGLPYAELVNLKTGSLDEYVISDNTKREELYNQLFSIYNPIQNVLRKEGRFLAPFFVRLAFRLYDGSHAMHTVPFLMVPTSSGAPFFGVSINPDGAKVQFTPLVASSNLHLKGVLGDLSAWKNLITHIDVFVTAPLISYTDSAESIKSVIRAPYATTVINGENVEWATDYQPDTIIYNKSKLYLKEVRSLREFYDNTHDDTEAFISRTSYVFKEDQKFNTYRVNGAITKGYLVVDLTAGDVGDLYEPGFWPGQWVPISPTADIPPKLPHSDKYKVFTISGGGSYKFKTVSGLVTGAFYTENTGLSGFENTFLQFHLQRTDNKDYREELTDYSVFYKCAEIDINDLNSADIDQPVAIKPDTLNNIAVQTKLTDSGALKQHKASFVFSYNNRLNICIKEEQAANAAGINAQSAVRDDTIASYEDIVNVRITKALVKIEENGQVIYKDISDDWKTFIYPLYFCYPSLNATELIYTKEYNKITNSSGDGNTEKDENGNKIVYTVNERISLTRHPFLNLAYAFNDFQPLQGQTIDELPQGYQTGILYGNKIKTSNVNNPFIFSEENTSELPVGEIYALSTAAKALSQGQFGQFPLYAFTDKGVWALEVTGTGTYSARQPITRDVVLNPESVTQIDDAVLFATERGIMLLSGSQVQCISEILDGKAFDWEQYGFAYKKTGELGLPTFVIPWEQYKANIQMLYDYTGQRIIVFNPDYTYSYVFSLDSKQWGIMESNIKSTVNYYPRAYAMTDTGDLVDYSAADKDFAEGYYITRPLKLDAPDIHKTITGIIQRGQFKKGHVNTMLYGSRDLDTWYPVYGSNNHILRGMRGTPYKYFRIASTFHLERDESITGCSVDYEPRLNNKLR